MNDTPKQSRSTLPFVLLVLIVLAVILVLLRPASREEEETTTGFDMDAHLEHMAGADLEKGFDEAAHTNALHTVGPEHLKALNDYNYTVIALRQREEQLAREHPQFILVAGMQDVLTNEVAAAEAVSDEVEARWKALCEQDAEWKTRQAAMLKADEDRTEARQALHQLIRARMQAQHKLKQLQEAAQEKE